MAAERSVGPLAGGSALAVRFTEGAGPWQGIAVGSVALTGWARWRIRGPGQRWCLVVHRRPHLTATAEHRAQRGVAVSG